MNKKFLAREILVFFGAVGLLLIIFFSLFSWNLYFEYRYNALIKERKKHFEETSQLREYIKKKNLAGRTIQQEKVELEMLKKKVDSLNEGTSKAFYDEKIQIKENDIKMLERWIPVNKKDKFYNNRIAFMPYREVKVKLVLSITSISLISIFYIIRPLFYILSWAIKTVRR